MSATGTDQNTTKKRKKGKSKRKAKSPLIADIDQTSQTGYLVGGAHGDQNVNKRLQLSNSTIFTSPVNPIYPVLTMNPQNMTSPGNSMQHFPYQYNMHTPITPQNPASFQNPPTAITATPPWAIELMEDMKHLKQSIPKIERIEKTVDIISVKMNEMEMKMKSMETRISETENACTFINTETEQHKNDLAKAKTEIKDLENKCGKLNQSVKSYETEQKNLKSKINDLESRSMRENLIFYGLAEAEGENCEELVKQFITDELNEDATKITLDRVHRLGSNGAKKPRPIVAKFHEFKQREVIRQKGYEEKETIKLKGFGVGIQQPKEIREARKVLYPIMTKEKEKGNRVRLTGDKLYINGELYEPLPTE